MEQALYHTTWYASRTNVASQASAAAVQWLSVPEIMCFSQQVRTSHKDLPTTMLKYKLSSHQNVTEISDGLYPLTDNCLQLHVKMNHL